MGKRIQNFWHFFKKYRLHIFLFLTGLVFVLILDHHLGCNFIILKNVKQCMVLGQSSWEWIKLLIGPVLVAIIGFFVQRHFKTKDEERRDHEKKNEENRIHQDSLTDYFDQMTKLILSDEWPNINETTKNTQNISIDKQISAIAKAITFSVLNEIDSKRKGSIILFLFESEALKHFSMKNSNLIGIDLKNSYLGKINLKGANLKRADLSRTILIGANLSNANLSGADLRVAFLDRADLEDADLSGANLSYAILSHADLSGTNLTRADLSGVSLKGAILSSETKIDPKWMLVHEIVNESIEGRKLSNIDLSKAKLRNAKLRNADLKDTDLSSSDLSNTDLRGADLSGANLTKTDLSGANLKGAILSSETKIDPKWMLVHEIVNESIEGRKLIGADLRYANLSNSNFVKADLSDADLSYTELSNADLSHATLINTDLSGSLVTHAKLCCANLWRANLSYAEFSGSNFENADLSETNLIGSKLIHTKNLTTYQVQSARNWQQAKFHDEIRKELGLPSNSSPKKNQEEDFF